MTDRERRILAAANGPAREVLRTIAMLPRRVAEDQHPIAIPGSHEGGAAT